MDQDIMIKFCVIGQSGVGKTSLLYQYIYKRFDQQVRPTIGCDFSTKLNSSVDGKPVRLQLWDIAGQERFTSVSKMYLRGALGCAIVCAANEKSTLEEALKWKKIIQENCQFDDDVKIPCLLVQNKSDLITKEPEQWQKKQYLQKFVQENQFCGYFQSSAKNNQNIDQIFQTLLDQTTKRQLVGKKNMYPSSSNQGHKGGQNRALRLTNEGKLQKKSKCC